MKILIPFLLPLLLPVRGLDDQAEIQIALSFSLYKARVFQSISNIVPYYISYKLHKFKSNFFSLITFLGVNFQIIKWQAKNAGKIQYNFVHKILNRLCSTQQFYGC